MGNIASVLKVEISRLVRKELRAENESLKKASAQYRSDIADLKRLTASLQKQITQFEKMASKNPPANSQAEVANPIRFTAKGFQSLRKKLGISAPETALLLGVSNPTIYSWEAGKSSPRKNQLPNIVKLRGMGKAEVRSLLEAHKLQA